MGSDAVAHAFGNGIGNSHNFSSSLPTQTLLESKKDEKWKQLNMDRLEQIAQRQFSRNLEFNKYYKMIRGEMVYMDYGLPDLTKEIVRLRDEMDFPVHARHYDFLGIIVNQIKGEYNSIKDRYIISTTDPISQNEFIRTQTDTLREYTQQMFNIELEQKLLQRGISLNPNIKFNSDEEKQAYEQQLQAEKDKIIDPEYQQKQLMKNWKTVASEWAERTLEFDQQRDDFDMDSMNLQEIEDYMLTGRWFRHYTIGYDYYKPERWHPCTVFFSEDLNTKYPQDSEYIGRIDWVSPSNFILRYGSKLSDDVQRRLSGYFNQSNEGGAKNGNNYSLETMARKNFGETHHIPFDGYYDYDLTLQMQDVFDTPLGETIIEENGEQKKIPAWFSPINNGGGFINLTSEAAQLRTDLDLRTDLLQVTEGYWRSFKRIGMLTYRDQETGILDTVYVTDDLLPQFLAENEIKTLRKVSLEQAEKKIEENTIIYTWLPEIRWFAKAKSNNTYLLEDLYIGGDALDFQVKGASNAYDAQMPVAGYIGDGLAKKLNPFIIQHNIVLNQVYSLLEKELGTFFLFDVHYLPSEYKDNGNTRQALEQIYDLIQDLSIVPVDTSKQNMAGTNGSAMNAFMTQSLDFTTQIVNRMNLATQFKLQALEQIGLTQQRTGAPSEYSTAEGIKQGMMASYAQTEPIYAVMAASSKKATLLHLTVAQYCQKNYKDYSFIYTKSDGDKAFIELSDNNFPLRNWGLIAISGSKDRKSLETLRSALLQNNTAGTDLQAFAEIMTSDSISELVEIGRQSRIKAQQEAQAERDHQQQMLDAQLKAVSEEQQKDREWDEASKEKDRETKIEIERISALGRASDKQSDQEGFDQINQATNDALSNNVKVGMLQDRQTQTDIKQQQANDQKELGLSKVNLALEQLKYNREKLKTQKEIALVNKN